MWAQRISDLTRTLTPRAWTPRLVAFSSRLRGRMFESATLFPYTVRRPHLIRTWLLTARTAQIALLVVIALNVFAMPPVRDRIVNASFSEESFGEKLGGIFGATSKAARRRTVASRVITATAWGGGTGAVLLLLWLHLPAARRRQGQTRQTVVSKRYRLEKEVGRGASGVVHRARDTVLDRDVALKELSVPDADDVTVERFRREAKIVAGLSHPNIVQVYDLVDEAGRVWIAMELVESGDLADMLDEQGALATETAARIAHEIAQAISYAHERGIVHRDLKPLNVLIDANGAVKVTDFGLAKLRENSVRTVEGTILGSPHYMSPEQANGRTADERSDIYSLGTILYHMLAGRPPFEGEVISVLMQHTRRPVPSLRKVSPDADTPVELEELVMEMLAKDPADRPQNMQEAAQRLIAFAVAPV